MLLEKNDPAYIWDIVDAARTIMKFAGNVSYQEYLSDRKLQLAVERALEIIGTAAKHVSEEFQKQHEDIPWKKIVAQRNVLAHEYGEIRQDRIWAVVERNIPDLIKKLESVLDTLS